MESMFSSPAEAALQREAGVPGLLTPLPDLDRVYELERVAGFIRDLGCERVRTDLGKGGSPLWGWVAQRIRILGDFVTARGWGNQSVRSALTIPPFHLLRGAECTSGTGGFEG